MKIVALTILLAALIACNPAKHATIASFWSDFQQAVISNDREAVAGMTHFPLPGAETLIESADSLGVTQDQFLQYYNQIFDDKVKSTIASTPANELNQYLPPKDAALERLSLPSNTAIYYLNILYTFNEESDSQTESSVVFYFLKEKGRFKLASISIAG